MIVSVCWKPAATAGATPMTSNKNDTKNSLTLLRNMTPPGLGPARLVTERHEQGVNPVVDIANDEPGEHDRGPAVSGGVPYVILAGSIMRGGDDEVVPGRVVDGQRLEIAHVGTVIGFRHGEASQQLAAAGRGEVCVVVTLGAEPLE